VVLYQLKRQEGVSGYMPTNEEEDREALKLLLRSLGFSIIRVCRAVRADKLSDDDISMIASQLDDLADRAFDYYEEPPRKPLPSKPDPSLRSS
jgi:hypothetical protein